MAFPAREPILTRTRVFPYLLLFPLATVVSCERAPRSPTSLDLNLTSPDAGGDNEEELIGDTLYGGAPFYQSTTGGLRARYLIKLGNDSMYYLDAPYHRWGWYTSNQENCGQGHPERHDIDADGVADSASNSERHCLANGEHTLTLDTLLWNEEGTAVVGRGTVFVRKVSMLGTLGAFETSSSSWFHDVRVALDRNPPEEYSLVGDIRAGDHFVSWTSDSLYPQGTADTIAAGDTLWFQSTYVATGQYSKPWFNSQRAILTGLSFDFEYHPTHIHGGTNSAPGTETSPALWQFGSGSQTFRVVGRVVAPHHRTMDSGVTQLDASIYVTTIAPSACFSVTGDQVKDSTLTFTGQCSSGFGTLEYRWTFDDGASVDWTADSAVAHHAYSEAGTYHARLRVRRLGSTAPVDSTDQTITVTGPLWVRITGPDAIEATDTYTWTSVPHDGAPPYGTYRWYYQQEGSSEEQVGTSRTYSRYVAARSAYTFRLRNTVQDTVPAQAEDTLWVEVIPGEDGYSAIGALDASNTCRPLPTVQRARQHALAAIARRGRWPIPCLIRTP